MKSLSSLIIKRKKTISASFSEKDIFYVFSRVVKEEFGNVGVGKLQPDFYKNKTIFVRALSSVWGSELFSNRQSIIKKINLELGEGAIQEIKIKQN